MSDIWVDLGGAALGLLLALAAGVLWRKKRYAA
ncbi:MAG: LPXTG cell wall anchor domain-containing protein [Intestinimonas sp.]